MKLILKLKLLVLAAVLLAFDAARAETIPVERVWSAHPVGFTLLSHSGRQFAAYFDAERRMSVAQRSLGSTNWIITKLDSTLGWDSHNYVTMAVDRDGRLHVSGNMHNVPLIYFRSEKPFDASSLKRATMTGDREQQVTYPVFFSDRAGRLIFRHRDGRSGSGDDLYCAYDEATRGWTRLMGGPLMSGLGKMNAYATVPKRGPDGRFHIVWVWRDTPDCASNHDISYAVSDDLVTWETSAGRKLALPITLATGDIVDPVQVRGGLLNVNREVGFDNTGRAVVSYHKYDSNGDLQAYVARHESNAWRIVQVSDWTGYRWDFSGGGTIIGEVSIGAIEAIGDGKLTLSYRYGRGSGIWVLDDKSLTPIRGAKPRQSKDRMPSEFTRLESKFAGMQKRIARDIGTTDDGNHHALVWETLPANRDRPPEPPHPEPVTLRVVSWPAARQSAR